MKKKLSKIVFIAYKKIMHLPIHYMKYLKKCYKRHFSEAIDISNQVLGFVGWVGGGMDPSEQK